MTAQDIINKHPDIPLHVAEEMVWLEGATGKPYGEVMGLLIEKYGKPMTMKEFLDMRDKVIHIISSKKSVANGGKLPYPIYDEVCDPRIDSPQYIKMIQEEWEQVKPKRSIGSLLRNGKVIVTGTPS